MKDISKIVEEGNILYRQNKTLEAREKFLEALEMEPENPAVLSNIGSTYLIEGNFFDAKKYLYESLGKDSGFMQAHYNLGNLFFNEGNYFESAKHYKMIEDHGLRSPEIYLNLATSYAQIGENENAQIYFEKYLSFKESDADALSNLGVVLSRQGKFEKAIDAYKKASSLKPDNWDTYYNLGILFARKNDFENAVIEFEKLHKLNPKHSRTLAHLVNRSPYILDWERWLKYSPILDELTEEEVKNNLIPGEQPFMSVIRRDDPQINYKIAKIYSEQIKENANLQNTKIDYKKRQKQSKRIRIGYVSDGFRDFPTGHNIVRTLELHDKNNFEVICYSHGPTDDSPWHERIIKTVDKFFDIRSLPDHEAAKKIREDNVDILIDLKGHTKDSRLGIFAYKPARLQMTWLGFPGTTGADFIDYAIVDQTVVPDSEEKFWSEKLVFMPHTYRSTDNNAFVSPIPFEREDFGLPKDAFIFASFNSPYKIDPLMFDTWMYLLRAIPNSVLWQMDDTLQIRKRLIKEAEKRGVGQERIIFAEKTIKETHLSRLKLADLALDTRIVNGHTTTVDALWAGLPVVALHGKHFCSRVSASVLSAIDMPELIATTLDEYKNLAIKLATDKKKLKEIKNKLQTNKKTTPLFDSERFTKNLEKAYKKVYQRNKKGLKPTHVYIDE